MLDNNLKTELIKRGTQVFDLKYRKLDINARDPLNVCALKLANFPKAVRLNHLILKGEFPHLTNRPENWEQEIDFPKPNEYSVEANEWLEWLNSQSGGNIQHGRNGRV